MATSRKPSKKPAAATKPSQKKALKTASVDKKNKQPEAMVWKRPLLAIRRRTDAFLDRRPHRSFQRTRRRDYQRSLKLPGYWAMTGNVIAMLRQYKTTFLLLIATYAILSGLIVGIASQDVYSTLTDTLRDTGDQVFEGNWGEIGKAGLLFATTITGGASQTLTESQQIYAAILVIMTWLTTVWLLRQYVANRKVKLRDGIYSAGAPILSTFVVLLVGLVQLLPLALALVGYSAALGSGLLNGGVEAMLFWIAAGLLALLSVYWVTSTFIALVIVTLPGMYPFQALRTAGDLVIGRRLRILLRLLWMILWIVITWVIVFVPVILLDTWLKGVWPAASWVPVIPVVLLVVSSATVVWAASYVYLLYRRIVADDAAPAL